MAALEQYRAKRDFKKTSEPAGKVSPAKKGEAGGIFVIHKHAATRLHYDLRLEHGGVLWSWAVTRGPSLDPDEKRLAVHVEDHPIEYAPFEGTIPKGEYGAGAVIVWDEGTWTPEHDPDKGMKKGHIDFELHGKKLSGKWHLVRLKPRPGEKRDNWLLIKSDDAAARPGEDILADAPQSVKSGLTVEEVGEGKAAKGKTPKVWHSNRPAAGKSAAKAAKRLDFIEPALATLQSQAPAGKEWLHEIKFDGYRMQAQIAGTDVRLLTRTGLDWTEKFGGEIVAALGKLKCKDAIIDGEIVVLGGRRHLLLLAVAGRPVVRPQRPHDLLCLRPDAARRRGSCARSRWSNASSDCVSWWASRTKTRCCASATILPSPARSCCSMPAAWALRASSPSVPTRPIAAGGARPGSSRNARSGRNSSSAAICRRRKPDAACARCWSATMRTAR